MDAMSSKKEQLHKAFLELQSHSSALVNFTVKWKELDDHFNDVEKLMQKRFEELQGKGKENGKETKSATEKSAGNSNNEKEKKSVAENGTGNANKAPEKKSDAEKSTGNLKASGKKSAAEKSTGNPNKTSEKKSAAEESTETPNKTSPVLKDDVKPRPQLKSLCEKMDGEGLKMFLVNSRSEVRATRNEIPAIRNEIPAALRCAADPAKLVLQTLEGFYPSGKNQPSNLDAQRSACDLLLESLPSVLPPDEVSSETKKDAQRIAAAWKSKLDVDAESSITRVRVHAFLQLLASYGISKEFKDDDLCDLVVRITRYPKVHDLCRALQISHKIPDIVEKLTDARKHIDAVQFVYEFGLVEKIPPVSLLKAYLKNEKKASEELANKGRETVGTQNASASVEIASLNTVIKCIQEHKLEAQMSSKDLEKRVAQLQNAKAERKRSAEVINSQSKRAHLSSAGGVVAGAGAGTLFPRPSPQSAFALSNSSTMLPKPTPSSAFSLSNSSDLHRPAPLASMPSYNLPGQGVYDRGSQGIYRSAYDVGSDQSSLSRSHLYPSDGLQSSLYGVGSFRGSTNYGSYNMGSGVPPTSSYQSSYLH